LNYIDIIKNQCEKIYLGFITFSKQNKSSSFFDIFIFCSLVGISFFLFGPNLDANWWVIDDHEIMDFTGPGQFLSFKEIIPALITKTEINPTFTIPRFRPAYYLLRLLETRLWYKHAPMQWYFFRILVFIFFISAIYLFFKKINGPVIGALLAIYITTLTFWYDIFARLGPSETYGVLGFTVFIIGFLIFLQNQESAYSWLSLLIGSIILIGSKENFAIILLPLFLIFFTYISSKPIKRLLPCLVIMLSLGWAFWIWYNLISRIVTQGGDVYHNPVSFLNRLSIIYSYFFQNTQIFIFLVIIGIFGFIGLFIKRLKSHKSLFLVMIIGSFSILALEFSQVIFYSYKFLPRYNFPLSLALPLCLSLGVYIIQKITCGLKRKWIFFVVTFLSALGILFLIKPDNWGQIHEKSLENVNQTHLFFTTIKEIRQYLDENPDTALIFSGNDAIKYYEPVYSYARFLRAMRVQNKFYLLWDTQVADQANKNKLAIELENQLNGYSTNGNPDWGFSPLNTFTNDPKMCLMVTFSSSQNPNIECDRVIDGNVFKEYYGLYEWF
jgi:hypothetical protein